MNAEPNGNHASRPVKVVLGDALDELRERETLLTRFTDELTEVRAAIKALAKIVESDTHPRATTINPAGDTKRAILETVRASIEPLTMEQIAERIGRKPAGWLSMQCKRLVGSGELVSVEDGYGLPSPIQPEAVAA